MKNAYAPLIILLFSLSTVFSASAQKNKDFYDTGTIQQVDLAFEQSNWAYILDSLRYNGDQVLLGDVTLNGKKIEDVGVRYRETRSFQPGSKRNSLEIILNYVDENIDYQGYKMLTLSAALRDPSMVREVLGYEIARQFMPAPKANYARVNINGKLYGLFVNIETVDAGFFQRHLGESQGPLYRSNSPADATTPEGCRSNIHGTLQVDNKADCYSHHFKLMMGFGYENLFNLAKRLNEKPQEISELLDVDRTLWMLAFNNAMLNLNSYLGKYSANYFLYRDKSGKFMPILGDLNLAFGSYRNIGTGSDLKPSAMPNLNPLLHEANAERPLIKQLLSNELYRKMYLSNIQVLTQEFLLNDKYLTRATELQKLIRMDIAKDANWPYTILEFDQSLKFTTGKKTKIPGISEIMALRADYLKKHPDLSVFAPTIEQVSVKQREKLAAIMLNTFKITAKVGQFPKKVKIFYRFDENESFREVTMLDEGKHDDGTAGDGIFGAEIVPTRGARSIEYYIFAENAKLVSYHPVRYMYERHKTSLDEINQ